MSVRTAMHYILGEELKAAEEVLRKNARRMANDLVGSFHPPLETDAPSKVIADVVDRVLKSERLRNYLATRLSAGDSSVFDDIIKVPLLRLEKRLKKDWKAPRLPDTFYADVVASLSVGLKAYKPTAKTFASIDYRGADEATREAATLVATLRRDASKVGDEEVRLKAIAALQRALAILTL